MKSIHIRPLLLYSYTFDPTPFWYFGSKGKESERLCSLFLKQLLEKGQEESFNKAAITPTLFQPLSSISSSSAIRTGSVSLFSLWIGISLSHCILDKPQHTHPTKPGSTLTYNCYDTPPFSRGVVPIPALTGKLTSASTFRRIIHNLAGCMRKAVPI